MEVRRLLLSLSLSVVAQLRQLEVRDDVMFLLEMLTNVHEVDFDVASFRSSRLVRWAVRPGSISPVWDSVSGIGPSPSRRHDSPSLYRPKNSPASNWIGQ